MRTTVCLLPSSTLDYLQHWVKQGEISPARVAGDYDRQSRLARELAVERFDAVQVVARVLEHALA